MHPSTSAGSKALQFQVSTLWTAYVFNPRINAQLNLTRNQEEKEDHT